MAKTIYLTGWGDCFPPCEYTNEDLCNIFNLPIEKAKKYEELIGVEKRGMCIDHWNGGKQIIRDDQMGSAAAKKALKTADISPQEIDVIITTCGTFDYLMPGLGERIQSNIKTVECHVVNLMGGCVEFINGLILAKLFLEQGQAETVLLTATEVGSAFYKNYRYPLQWFVKGDAGGAFILSTKKQGPYKVGKSYYKNIGRLENMFSVPLWGIKEPCPLIIENEDIDPSMIDVENVDVKYRWYRSRLRGTDSFKMAINAVNRTVNEVIKNKDETYYILPQQELNGLKAVAKSLGAEMGQVSTDFINHGYTANVTPAVSFCESFDKLVKYQDVVLAEIGAGASLGAVLLEKV